MKLLIVSACGKTIPVTKGGAVATLIESIIIQNEKNKEFDLTVIAIYDKEAIENSKKYKNTNFIFIKKPKLCTLFDNLYEKAYSLIFRKTHKTLKKYLWKIYLIIYLRFIILKNSYDKIVFENSGFLLNIINKKIKERYKGKLYYHIHNDIPDNISVEKMKKCKLLLISKYLKKKIIKKCGSEIEKQIYIVKNGLDISLFTQKLNEKEIKKVKSELKIDFDKKIILFVGRFDETKGVEELLEAFKKLPNKEKCILLIVGSHNFGEKQTSAFEIRIKRNISEIKDNVRFTGFIPHNDVWKYYRIANVSVLPSIWEEPAGLTMVESILSETPLITTKSGGIPEYISEKDAILLDRDEKLVNNISKSIEKVLRDEEKWKIKVKEASKKAKENFSEEKYFLNFTKAIKN